MKRISIVARMQHHVDFKLDEDCIDLQHKEQLDILLYDWLDTAVQLRLWESLGDQLFENLHDKLCNT